CRHPEQPQQKPLALGACLVQQGLCDGSIKVSGRAEYDVRYHRKLSIWRTMPGTVGRVCFVVKGDRWVELTTTAAVPIVSAQRRPPECAPRRGRRKRRGVRQASRRPCALQRHTP